MLPELAETDAEGERARIYGEVRDLCGVPYVSSLQRHLATRPGWLEWAWSAVRPAFTSGRAQEAAWAAAASVTPPPLAPLTASALRVLGVDDEGRARIRDVCESFIRVSPTNLMFSALMRAQLQRRPAAADAAAGEAPAWLPPPRLATLPALVDMAAVDEALRDTLMQLGNEVDGRPFVPGLYRMLAHWPAYLAHVATELGPRFDDPATRSCCQAIAARVDAAANELLPSLPHPPPQPPRPDAAEHPAVLAALQRYRGTSPEMVVFATLLRDALPLRPGRPTAS
jgi:hypothetical protein